MSSRPQSIVVDLKFIREIMQFMSSPNLVYARKCDKKFRCTCDNLEEKLKNILEGVSEIYGHRDHVHEGEFPYTHSLAALNSISLAALNSIYSDTKSGIEMPDESDKPLKAPAQEIKNFWATWNHGLHWELPAMSWPYWKVMSCSIGYIFSGAFRARSINEVAEIISGAYEYKYGLIAIKEFEEKPNGWAPFDPVMRFTRKDWMQW